jgi:hypothetical protein
MGIRNIGECFVRLVKIKDLQDKDYLQEFIDYDGEDSSLLDCYNVDTTLDGEYASMLTREELNEVLDDIDTVGTAFMYGSSGDRRCTGSEVQVFITDNGEVYMDEGLMDYAFC